MSKILFRLFPLIDHLYIYQNFEYESWEFFKWFLKNPFKRNLQKKHQLQWTTKAKLLLLVSLVLILLDAVITSLYLSGDLILTLILIPIKFLYAPLFLIAAQILISPVEDFQKQKILKATQEKLNKLPNLKVVAITGSFGKTSTKDILYTLLFKKFYVVKTPKSFNTSLGISQTILTEVKNNSEIFICEVGAYRKGEIKKIAKLIKPDIGVITAVAPQHLQKFGYLENIAMAKFELVENLSQNGIIILNGEYKILEDLSVHLRGVSTNFYGRMTDPYHATAITTGINGTSFTLHTPKGKAEIAIPFIGEHHVENFLAASAAALNLGLTLSEIKKRAKLLLPTSHRLEIKKQGNLTIIDNTYNTNPKSARASLKLLQQISRGQKIIITPGLIELGKEASKKNQEFAKDAAEVVDEFVIVGENAKNDLLKGLKDANFSDSHIHLVNSPQLGISSLGKILKPNAVVLLENDLPDQYS